MRHNLLTLFDCGTYSTEFADIIFLIQSVPTFFVEIRFVASEIVDTFCGKCLLAKKLLMCLGRHTFLTTPIMS